MKEIIAKNLTTGMTIYQRFFEETGERFIKVTPASLGKLILPNLKKSFEHLPVEVIESSSGWLQIKKMEGAEDNDKLKQAGEKAVTNLAGDTAFDKEVNMLKGAGFKVETKEVQDGKSEE